MIITFTVEEIKLKEIKLPKIIVDTQQSQVLLQRRFILVNESDQRNKRKIENESPSEFK